MCVCLFVYVCACGIQYTNDVSTNSLKDKICVCASYVCVAASDEYPRNQNFPPSLPHRKNTQKFVGVPTDAVSTATHQ